MFSAVMQCVDTGSLTFESLQGFPNVCKTHLISSACYMKPPSPGSCLPLHHLPSSQVPQELSFTHPQYFATSRYQHPRISSPALCICRLPTTPQEPVLSPPPSVSSPWALSPVHPKLHCSHITTWFYWMVSYLSLYPVGLEQYVTQSQHTMNIQGENEWSIQ